MTILFQGWPHDGIPDRQCSKECRTCNLTAEVQAEIDYRVKAERERAALIVERCYGHEGWPKAERLIAQRMTKEIREGK